MFLYYIILYVTVKCIEERQIGAEEQLVASWGRYLSVQVHSFILSSDFGQGLCWVLRIQS